MESLVSYVNTLFVSQPLQNRSLIVFVGPKRAGKTTLLYRFKLGKFLETVPTVDYNGGLSFPFHLALGPTDREIADTARITEGENELAIWDIADSWCSTRQNFRFLESWDTVFVFVVDVTNDIKSNPAIDDLKSMLSKLQARYLAVVFNKLDAKSYDNPEVQELMAGVNEVLERYRPALAFSYEVFDNLEKFSAATGAQTDILLKRLAHIATTRNTPAEKPSRDDLLKRIESTSKNPNNQLSPNEFVQRMVNGTLEAWDHRSYLRAAFLTLRDCLFEKKVVSEASKLLVDRFEAMESADPEKFQNVPHMSNRTLVTFWVHHVYLSMLAVWKIKGSYPEPEGFDGFLAEYPDLMDDKSWATYYTKKQLFEFAIRQPPPDIKPLPEFIYRGEKAGVTEEDTPKIPGGNAGILRRFAHAIIKTVKSRNERRAAVINETLPVIQSRIMSLRAKSRQAAEPYSETHAYFWIQMIHAAAESLPSSFATDITKLDFDSFMLMFPDLLDDDDLWKDYYSPEKWNSMDARMKTVLPDLKPFPNVFQSPDQSRVDEATFSMDEKHSAKGNEPAPYCRPTKEELLVEALRAGKPTAESTDNDTDPPDTHAGLIRRIFDRIVEVEAQSDEKRATSLTSAAWDAVSFLSEEDKMTRAVFWSQMVLQAFITMDTSFYEQAAQSRAKKGGLDSKERTQLFLKFLSNSPQICWENLWTLYYSDRMWKSEDAKQTHVLPDKRPIPAYLNGEDVGFGDWELITE